MSISLMRSHQEYLKEKGLYINIFFWGDPLSILTGLPAAGKNNRNN